MTNHVGVKYTLLKINQRFLICSIFLGLNMFRSDVENFTGQKIKALQSDNDKEYCNYQFNTFLREHEIKRRLTTPRKQNIIRSGTLYDEPIGGADTILGGNNK